MSEDVTIYDELRNLATLHQDVLGGVGYANNGSTGSGYTTYDDSLLPDGYPAGHVPFYNDGSVALPAIGATSTVVSFIVPTGYSCIITYMSNNFLGGGFTPSSGDIVWRLTVAGKPVRNFEAITSERGSNTLPVAVEGIRAYSGQTVMLVVNHAGNALLNGDVTGSLIGKFIPAVGGL